MHSRMIMLLLGCFVLLSACTTPQDLQYTGYENFKVSNVATEPKINVDLKMHYPGPIGATIKDMSLSVSVNDKPIGTVGLADKVHVKRKSDFILPIECNTSLQQLGGVLSSGLSSYFSDKEIPLGLSGEFTIQKFIFFRRTFAFSYSDKLDVKQIK